MLLIGVSLSEDGSTATVTSALVYTCHFPLSFLLRMGQLCPDYINRTATTALFAPRVPGQTSYHPSVKVAIRTSYYPDIANSKLFAPLMTGEEMNISQDLECTSEADEQAGVRLKKF